MPVLIDLPSGLIVFKSDASLAEDHFQGVEAAGLGPVLFNYLAKTVVPAAHGKLVWGFGEWHDGALVYHYRVDLHHRGAPVNNPEDLPRRRMRSAQSFGPRFSEALSTPRITLAV